MIGSVPRLFDRRAIAQHRSRAMRINGDRFLVREAVEGLAHRLSAVNRNFETALDLDSGTSLDENLVQFAAKWDRLALGPEEVIPGAPGSYDLVVSVLSLHAVNDLPGLLAQVRRVLKPDGLFLAALFSGATLIELRQAFAAAEAEISDGMSPRVFPFADVRDLGMLLQRAGLTLPVADIERTLVRYQNIHALVRDLRSLGETNVLAGRRSQFMSRRLWRAVIDQYARAHADSDGRLRATFEIAYLTGWAPHESQQQPLKPGSAKTRLADALGTSEIPLKR